MQLPSEIQIGPYLYEVIVAKDIVDHRGNKSYGRADYSRHHILLDEENPEDRMKVVLLHEIFHCILEAAGFGDDVKMEEEDLVLRVSPWWAQVLMDNKELREFYSGG